MKLKRSAVNTVILLLQSPVTYGLIEISRQGTVAEKEYVDDELSAAADTEFVPADSMQEGSAKSKMKNLQGKFGQGNNNIRADSRSGRVSFMAPDVPLLPGKGKGNRLLWTVYAGDERDLKEGNDEHGKPDFAQAGLDALKGWLSDNQVDIDVDVAGELFHGGTAKAVSHGDGNTIQMHARRSFKGVPVVGSHVSATLVKGNLVGVSVEKWGTIPENFSIEPKISAEEAAEALADHAGRTLAGGETCKPEIMILTLANGNIGGGGNSKGKGKGNGRWGGLRKLQSETGNGYKPVLAWQVCPKLEGQEQEMLQGYVDAQSGSARVLSFLDKVDYFEAMGDVYPLSNDGEGLDGVLQDGWPMPYLDVGGEITTTGGSYGSASSSSVSFEGPYVKMVDTCGTASLDPVAGVDWSGSDGTDCETPGFGGAGNTHSSRSGFYELNKMMEIARSHLPDNTWLQQKLTSNMNIASSCNAFFHPGTGQITFYQSGNGCANTGEIAAIFDHEWGHAMDFNDGVFGISAPSGEGIADVYSALRLNDSCIGRGFRLDGFCNGCNSCSGVRDIDYRKKGNGNSPSTRSWASLNCGTNTHCRGHVYSEAVWDLYTDLLPAHHGYDANTALELTQRLTYMAAGAISTWYNLYATNEYGGCEGNSGYKAFLQADDDNGNLSDGTPHMTAIYEAFHRHEIACNDMIVQDSGCAGSLSLTAPDVTVTPGNGEVQLNWEPVTNAAAYQVFRTEGVHKCAQGKVVLATITSSESLSYLDTGLQNGREYSYIVIPKGGVEESSSCFGHSSDCKTATPVVMPSFQLSCPTGRIYAIVENAPSHQRDCMLVASGGFTGVVSLACSTTGIAGVSCVGPSPSSEEFFAGQTTTKTVSITVQVASSATGGPGEVTLTATSGSVQKTSSIPVTLLFGNGPQVAQFDDTNGVPRCIVRGTECSSKSADNTVHLLKGRSSLGPEANHPNTLDACADGGSGSYESDESLEWIKVKSTTGDNMKVDDTLTVEAGVYCWGSGSTDYADFYHTTTPGSPNWSLIDTVQCPGGGHQTIMTEYDSQAAGTNVIRVQFRYGGNDVSTGACTSGDYNDRDDLMFEVEGQSPITPSPTKNSTPNPTKQPTPIPTKNPSEQPTPNPVSSPTKNPTPNPTKQPTPSPTNDPTKQPTPNPTNDPTKQPTPNPTNNPTKQPTPNPTNDPTATTFVELTTPPRTGSAYVLGAAYFDVTGGDVWSKITDLQITSYYATRLQVYSKFGSAKPYEATPCAWKLIAETATGWNGGSWTKQYPQWNDDGFKPVILPSNETVSFYVVALDVGTSYAGILGKVNTDEEKYSPWIATPETSSVGLVTMSHGRKGYSDSPFKPFSDYYTYGIWGGIKLENVDTDTSAPTMAPTSLYLPGDLESPMKEVSADTFNGLQFDVENLGLQPVIVNSFSARFASMGYHHMEVWMREGSHMDSSAGCDNWNNWCNDWTKLADTSVQTAGSGSFTSSGQLTTIGIINPGSTAAFAIVSGEGLFLTKDGALSDTVQNDELRINLATPIDDYYGDSIQSIYPVNGLTKKVFQGIIHYEVANSLCAIQSKADWVDLDPSSSSLTSGTGPQTNEIQDSEQPVIVTMPGGRDEEDVQ